jgi:hypothetical protein
LEERRVFERVCVSERFERRPGAAQSVFAGIGWL